MKTKSFVVRLCVLPLAMPAPALAQTVATPDADADAPGDDIVVTANRTPTRLDQVGQSITVLDQDYIEKNQAVGVTELLAQTPGVQFSRNGGAGKSTSIYIRGAETGQTLVLIDGVRLNDPSSTDTGASMSDILSGDISRIEVLRGAQSTLWGSQAIGGVINIITRTPSKDLELNGQLEAGGLETYYGKAGAGGKSGALTWQFGGGYMKSRGISAIAAGTEPDGYENFTANGRAGIEITDNVALDLRSFYSFGRSDFDSTSGDAPVYGKSRQWLNYVGLNFDLFGRLKNRIAYANTDITRLNFDSSASRRPQPITFDAKGTTDRFEYQGTLDIARGWTAVFGAEYAENGMRTASPTVSLPNPTPIQASDNTTGIYAQIQGEFVPGLTLTGGLRHEDHSTFGSRFVGAASGAWSLNGGKTVFRASWAQGFKAPSLYQLYSQYGNTGLVPETAESWDAGAQQTLFGALTLSAVYFQRDTENLIVFTSCNAANASNPLCAAPRTAFYENVGRVKAKGVELGANLTIGGLNASANYTYLDATNTTANDVNRGKRLARRPQDNFNVTLNYTWPFKLLTGVSVRYSGDNFNNAPNTQLLKAYTLVDVRIAYPITDQIEIYGRVENAFDEVYQTTLNYGSNPRVAYGGVRLRF